MKRARRLLGACALIALAAPGIARAAETAISQRNASFHRILPLKKITVGPDDQYDSSITPAGDTLVFTHKSDLVPHLCRQNIASGDVTDLLTLTADSQEGVIGPDGRVAFTYYKFNARGDVCYAEIPKDASQPVSDDKITCLKAQAGEEQSDRSTPFWRSSHELGFLLRDINTQAAQIVSEDLVTGARTVLAKGKVWAPAMAPGGHYLFYSEMTDSKTLINRVLKLKDLASGQVREVHFALPGISGFPSVSDDEKYIYFSHYLDDTNGDNVIDGSDNSIVFRAEIARILGTPADQEVFPEQLTSVESNCSFPRPYKDVVYASCAFEGSLDVYELPASGIVPSDWNLALLENAHQTSRSYAERILLLNTMQYRGYLRGSTVDERLLGDHLLADDTTAAKYYISRLKGTASPQVKDVYHLLKLYLSAREAKKAQPSAEISREFQGQIQAIDEQVASAKGGQARFQNIVRGLLRTFLNQPLDAQSFLAKVKFDTPALPLERYLAFELASWTLPRAKPKPEIAQAMIAAYRQMAGAPELSEETQLHYAFDLLAYIQQTTDAGDPKALARRSELIAQIDHGLPSQPDQLLQSEVAVLGIIQAQGDPAKNKAYAPLDKLMSASRSDYFLRKALYIRAILNFTEAGEFKFMDFVANSWLRYTANSDTEFVHAREFYATAQLSHGYAAWGQKNYTLAASYFYGSLSMTDDLESHADYLLTMVLNKQRALIDERYKNLTARNVIVDNMKFVQALLLLIDDEEAAAADPSMVKHLDAALALLNSMEQDRDSPVRYLLVGYCNLDKLLRTGVGFEIDQDLFQAAHRAFMLAYDLGRDNDRIKAAVLMDLGILHQRAQNHGLAAKFFSLRKPLGFVSSAEAASFAWKYARSLYYTHEPDRAADELAKSPGDVPKEFVGPLLEREAFYRTNAGQYDQAAELYGRLLQGGYIQGDPSLAKVNLDYGLALLKLKRDADARTALQAALDHAARMERAPRDRSRLIDSDPLRIRVAAYGLLGRVGSEAERLDALEKRAQLLPDAKKYYDTSYLPTVIENRLSLAELATKVQPAQAAVRMKEALELGAQLGDEQGYLSNAVFRALSEYLAHGWLHPDLYVQQDTEKLRKVYDSCVRAYDSQPGSQPVLEYQKIKLQLLWAAYSAKVLKGSRADLKAIAGSDAAAGVKTSLPAQWKELQALSVALAR